jgi:uncharacterized protein (DUF1330 family)
MVGDMAAYIIADTKIHDAEGYEEYKTLARAIAEKHGGRYLARGGALHVDDHDLWSPTRIVIIEFPDVQSARRFLDSEEYAPVKELRHKYADSTIVLVEGM